MIPGLYSQRNEWRKEHQSCRKSTLDPDTVFEPFMLAESPAQRVLSGCFGTGKGSGIGLMFFIVGIAGMLVSFTRLRKPVYRELDRKETNTLQTELNGGNKDE